MRVIRHLRPGDRPFRRPVVALGNFDGVHLGHREILARAAANSTGGADVVVFTFQPHPVRVLFPERAPVMISSLAGRLRALRAAGVDGVVVQRFTRSFSQLTPREFAQRLLVDALGVSAVVVGYNVTFGKDRKGTPEVLEELGQELGFGVEVVSPVAASGDKLSSSEIRKALAAGDVAQASRLLGRPHSVQGIVRHGDHRGATIGFPTANLFPRGGALPPDGVYAVRATLPGETDARPGVANLGLNPTFGIDRRRLEVHLFDFERDLYGSSIRVDFVERLRGEQKFGSVDELIAQIGRDADQARAVLGV